MDLVNKYSEYLWEQYGVSSKTSCIHNVSQISGGQGYMGFSYSPDSSQITFSVLKDRDLRTSDIYVMNSDGTQIKCLTDQKAEFENLTCENSSPRWSPDGTKIAFSSNRSGNYQIHLMNPDGTNIKNISQNSFDEDYPDWSPDGKNIVFVSNKPDRLNRQG